MGYERILCGILVAGAIAALAGGVILRTNFFDLGFESLGFTKLSLIYFVTCLCMSVAMLVVSREARKQSSLMWLFCVAILMVVAFGFPAPRGGELDEVKLMLDDMLRLCTKLFMYGIPAFTAVSYALIAFGAQEARNEAKKSLVPGKE